MKKSTIRNIIFTLAICMAGVACSETSTSVDNNAKSATFRGKVVNGNMPQTTGQNQATPTAPAKVPGKSSMSPVKGAVVTAAYVKANGNLEMIGNNQVKTNAEGEYTLKVDLSMVENASNRIVIMAKNSGQTTKAFVATRVKNGETVTVQPITFESTAETAVYQQVIANNDENMVTQADIDVVVDANVAAEIESSSHAAGELAEALVAASKAKAKFYAQKGIKITKEQHQQIMEAKQKAAITLASKLNSATSAETRQDAYRTFLKTVANAEMNAGIKAWAAAESNNFAAHVMLSNSTMFSSDVKQEIRQNFYFYTAVAVDAAAQAQAKAVGASSNTISAIADAGATLKSKIMGTTHASATVISDAFAKFNEDVKMALKNDSSINGSAFVTANSTINGTDGLKSILETQLKSATDINAMLSVYSDFYAGVKSLVQSIFTNAGNADAQAYARLLIVINLAS